MPTSALRCSLLMLLAAACVPLTHEPSNGNAVPPPAATAAEPEQVEPPGPPTGRGPPPISGGTLAVMANGTLVAADPDRDVVWVLGEGKPTVRKIALTGGDEPGRVIEGPLGHAFVALRAAGQVAELDLAAGTVVARHDACAAPRGMGWSGPKSMLTVACATGVLARLYFVAGSDAYTPSLRALQHPADDLRDVVQREHDVLVSTFRSARVFAVADDGTPSAFFTESPSAVPAPGSLSPTTTRVAWRLAGTSNGALLLAQAEKSDAITSTPSGPSYGTPGQRPVVQPTLSIVLDDGKQLGFTPVFSASLAVDAAVSPKRVFAVASPGNGLVVRNDVMLQTAPVLTPCAEPTSVAFRGEELVVFCREPAQLAIYPPGGTTPTLIPIDAASVANVGHTLFHRSTGASLSCASCHPEGGDDGHVWFLPEGQRRTVALTGGLRASAPFHWEGDRPTMKSLLQDVMVKRMNGTLPSASDTVAMLDWLDAQPTRPRAPPADADQVQRGQALFASAQVGCAACHSGALGTNNVSYDVGTGGRFQTPRLVGLAARAPYFHDGRVATLEDRFTPAAGGEAHGHTNHLTDGERADLLAYLRSW